MNPIAPESQVNNSPQKLDRIDLPIADWHYIHDTALDLHRSLTLFAALQRLAESIEHGRLGSQIGAILSSSSGEKALLVPTCQAPDAAPAEKIGYEASFNIQLSDSDTLRLSIVLPIEKSVLDQTKLELLLEHFSIAGQRLPIH